MQPACLFIFNIFFAISLQAQQSAGGISIRGKFGNEINISDINGRPFGNEYSDVTGSPWFDEVYKYASIKLVQGQIVAGIQTKINLVAQEIVLITANGVETSIPAGMVKEIFYSDTGSQSIKQYTFKIGFPPVDKLTANNFYQVLAEGRCTLLKAIVKSISEKKNDLSGEVMREFETYEDYYIYTKAGIQRMKKEKDFILEVMQDNMSEVNQFLQSNKINFKNENSLIKLFNFYNSIP